MCFHLLLPPSRFSALQDNTTVQNGGNRHTTVLVYLSDVEEGGETVFSMLPPAQGQEATGMSECAAKHLAVKPKKGTGERQGWGSDQHLVAAFDTGRCCLYELQSHVWSDSIACVNENPLGTLEVMPADNVELLEAVLTEAHPISVA